jgi:hypothetical protein
MTPQPPGLGRIGRAENDIRVLVQGVGDLQKDMNVVVDYVRAKK